MRENWSVCRKRRCVGAPLVASRSCALVLLTGRAKVTNFDEEGREIILAWLSPGEFFGEMGLIDGSPRSANVVAVEPCELLTLGKQEFQRCMQDNFQVMQKLMQILVRRLREADRNIESLALLDVCLTCPKKKAASGWSGRRSPSKTWLA